VSSPVTSTSTIPDSDGQAVVPSETEQPPQPQKRSRVFDASVWTMVGYVGSQVLRLGGNIVLSYWIAPAAFGLMTLVNIVVNGLNMFSDVGLGASIIQNDRGDDPTFRNTAWTVQTIRGVILWLCACLLAWPASLFYEEPRLLWLIPAVAISALISGFDSTSLFTVRRHLQFGRLTILELSAQATGVFVMLTWAWMSPSVIALVAGSLVTALVKMVASHFFIAGAGNRFQWDSEAFTSLFHFGKWIFISTIITFFAEQSDRLVLGKLVSMDALGIYGFGFAIGVLPLMLLSRLSTSVVVAHLAQAYRAARDSMRHQLFAAREILLPLAVFIVLGVVLEAESFFILLYSEQFHGAGPIAQLLSAWVWIMILSYTLNGALLAAGDSRSLAVHNLATFLGTIAASIAGYYLAGTDGFILGMAVGALCGYIVMQVCLSGHGINSVRQDLRFTLCLVALAFPSLWLADYVSQFGPWFDQFVRFPVLIAVGLWALHRLRGLWHLR
jgi:O-antigen/teichoic acid export membrane protein